jgi:NAD(P)-dependent dehydrogenase (short-subunit alcohol dehydrogenase family)
MLDSFAPESNVLIQGASRGIGLEFVRQCLAAPRVARVVATCRVPAAAAGLHGLAEAARGRLQLVPLDVTDESSIAAAADATRASVGSLHLLVNCAGVLHDARLGLAPEKRLADVGAAALVRSFTVNAAGPLLVARHFEPCFAHRDRAVFASISARVGSIGDNRLGGWYAYRGSKAAQNMFTRTLAVEWGRSRRNVICAALHPGTTDTDLSRPFQAGVPAGKLFPAQRTVTQLLDIIDRLRPEDSGQFFGWDGERIPW